MIFINLCKHVYGLIKDVLMVTTGVLTHIQFVGREWYECTKCACICSVFKSHACMMIKLSVLLYDGFGNIFIYHSFSVKNILCKLHLLCLHNFTFTILIKILFKFTFLRIKMSRSIYSLHFLEC